MTTQPEAVTPENWALFKNHYLMSTPLFAAVLVSRTPKTIRYAKQGADGPSVIRNANWLVLDGLTQAAAELAAFHDRESRLAMEAECEAAKTAHAARRKALIAGLARPEVMG